jgi:hypothetical protein
MKLPLTQQYVWLSHYFSGQAFCSQKITCTSNNPQTVPIQPSFLLRAASQFTLILLMGGAFTTKKEKKEKKKKAFIDGF